MSEKTCSRCGETYPTTFFRRDHSAYAHAESERKRICKGCEQKRRDERKIPRRWPSKVRDCTNRHARKLGIPVDILIRDYGWVSERMEHEAEYVYGNGCPTCGHAFAEMGHGLGDITLDITDPQAPPTYGANTQWMCMTCNRAKGKTPPALYAEVQMCWNRWKRRQVELEQQPIHAGTLFEGTDWDV